MSNPILSYQPGKGDTPPPHIIHHPPTEEGRALLVLARQQIPQLSDGSLGFQLIDIDPIVHRDPRLRGYRVYLFGLLTGGGAMPRIRIEMDDETYGALLSRAGEDLRTLPDQALVLIRKGLGLAFPYPPLIDVTEAPRQVMQRVAG